MTNCIFNECICFTGCAKRKDDGTPVEIYCKYKTSSPIIRDATACPDPEKSDRITVRVYKATGKYANIAEGKQ